MSMAMIAGHAGEESEAGLHRLGAIQTGKTGRSMKDAHDGRPERAGVDHPRAGRV